MVWSVCQQKMYMITRESGGSASVLAKVILKVIWAEEVCVQNASLCTQR